MTTADSTPPARIARLQSAAPFALSLLLIPLVIFAATQGGWVLILPPLATWWTFSILDLIFGTTDENPDPETPDEALFWHRVLTMGWFPLQALTLFWLIWYVPGAPHLALWESIAAFFNMGVMSGTVGIVYAHELIHQKNRSERWLGDLLLGSVLYCHFRTEHLLVHHRYVGTPRDGVTARYGENVHRFIPRVIREGIASAWRAEAQMLSRKNLPVSDFSNPFWRYGGIQVGFLITGFLLGGWFGLVFFIFQAFVAIWQLELINYIEHYGLTRKYLGDGKYEHVKPHHSWNATERASNFLLINLQRHSDHHYKPDRRFPLLQSYTEYDAPRLPHGYPIMTLAALYPPLWFKIMNPRVRKWRALHYPEITDWTAYKQATTPMPKGAS